MFVHISDEFLGIHYKNLITGLKGTYILKVLVYLAKLSSRKVV